MSEQTPPAERLLNLVIALVNTPGRMTKEQIRATVTGYADAASDDAFERMFERDKDTLRDLGIPVTTVTAAGHGDDIGYRVDQDSYALPPIDLTSAELAALSLAAEFWQDRSVRTETSRALTKLRAVGAGGGTPELASGIAPVVRAAGRSFRPLLDAIQDRCQVGFTYRAASTGDVRERTVEPWRLVARRAGWILVGWDVDRQDARSFLLSRIEGKVRTIGPGGEVKPPEPERVAAALRAWDAGHRRSALLAVRPEHAEVLRARGECPNGDPRHRDLLSDPMIAALAVDRDLVRVHYRATWQMAEEVVTYGDAVLVLDPPELRAAVVQLLHAAAGLDSAAENHPEGTDG